MGKKIISLLLIAVMVFAMFALTGCGAKQVKEGALVYESYNDKNLAKINVTMPTAIETYHSAFSASVYLDPEVDSQEFADVVDAFSSLTIVKKADISEEEYYEAGDILDLTFYWENEDFSMIEFIGNYVTIYDEKTDSHICYEVEDIEILSQLLFDIFGARYSLPVTYETIYDQNGLTFKLGEHYVDSDGNYVAEIVTDNNTDKDIDFRLNAVVNGYPFHAYQSMGVIANSSDTGYYLTIMSSLLKLYGIDTIGEVDFTIDVFEQTEFLDDGELVASMPEPYKFTTDDFANMDTELTLESPLYSKDGVAIYGKRVEGDFYTMLGMCYVNDTDEDKVIALNSLTLDGKAEGLGGLEIVYRVPVPAKTTKFAILPLSNYTWNQETGEVKKEEANEIKVSFLIQGTSDINTNKAVIK